MKNRWYLWTFIMIAGFVVLLLVSGMIGNTGMTSLGAECPEILEGKDFQGEILRSGGKEGVPLLLTDDQFQQALTAVEVREMGPFEGKPDPCISVTFSGEQGTFALLLGKDGSICVETPQASQPSRRFFLDRTGAIFRGLYEEHLLSGGGEIPES